jgi:quercetin dioxygenase-like cupin family protein
MKQGILLVVAALLPVVGAAGSSSVTVRPTERAWEQFGLADRVPVLGDVTDPDCPSVTLVRLHKDVRLPLHSAPADRTYLLLSGTIHLGIGKRWDEARMRTLPAGSFWVVPANTITFEWAEDEVVVQVSAIRSRRDCPRVEDPVVITPDRIAWKPSGSVERAVLSGEPSMPGCPYVERFRLPTDALSALPPAPPPGEVVWTVLSGTLHRAMGSAEQPVHSTELPAGTVTVVPATSGVAGAGQTGTVAQRQFAGTGPPVCKWREPHR